VQHIRNVIKPLVEEDKEVIVVGHSAGGALGAAATKDLSLKERTEAGKGGGVKRFVFLSAGLAPAGWRHPDILDFYDIQVRRRLFLLLLSPAARCESKKLEMELHHVC
jgi:pimeloyl-ACP methyl ester carboxylesterase